MLHGIRLAFRSMGEHKGFALAALLTLALGIGANTAIFSVVYGVLSYTVARRQREIGVRSALGATRLNIVSLVVREGMTVAVLGLVAGLGGAAVLTRLMQALLYGVEPLDPVSFTAAPAALLLVALVACALPARRAAATDPAIALRQE
jgi:putative ABC transport system permease protein